MRTLELNGNWTVAELGSGGSLPAVVPGAVHLDLERAGRIPDPFYRDNEKHVQWVGERDWVYACDFLVPAEFLKEERVVLQFEGLDTLASVAINGQVVGRADNMFRAWEFEVKKVLRPGANRIEVTFASAHRYTLGRQGERYIHSWLSREDGAPYLRKEQCNFGWDWGPKLITCGIWRPVRLVGWSGARIESVAVQQDHQREGGVGLTVEVELQLGRRRRRSTEAGGLSVAAVLSLNGQPVAEAAVDGAREASQRLDLLVTEPKLWYPRGLGEQPLYQLRVELLDAAGQVLDAWTRRIGLRTLRLDRRPDEWGECFQFIVNGEPFFAKGANWIPADVFVARVTPEHLRDLLTSAAEANMNMLRVWGGGIYEEEAYYDLCDELGLCVWQDFMFACGCYPTFDRSFMANVRREAEEAVRRLRHHACLALWCGNNELEQGICGPKWTEHQMSWKEYAKIFDRMLPEVVGRLDPQRDYWPGSPHTPAGDRRDCNNPNSGDAHLWAVWHRREPFEWYRTSRHRFCSEFGFQSFPEPRTIAAFTLPEDRNLSSYVMDSHQKSWVGNGAILGYLASWYRMPKDFESLVWSSQIVQARAMKYAVEHWRRQMPRSMGALYWQLNDTWPGPSWSSLDYFGRWKALQYAARRFFAPVLLSLVEEIGERRVVVWATNDRRLDLDGRLRLTVTDCEGQVLRTEEKTVSLPRLSSGVVGEVSFLEGPGSEREWQSPPERPLLTAGGVAVWNGSGPRDLLVWAELEVEGKIVSRNLAAFVPPKHLELVDPELRTEVAGGADGELVVIVTARRPALQVWLELEGTEARMSDNFFDLPAGVPYRVKLKGVGGGTLPNAAEAADRLRVRSLWELS